MENEEGLAPLLVLRCVRGLGAVGLRRLVEKEGSAEAALASLRDSERRTSAARALDVHLQSRERGLTILFDGASGYPSSLEALEDNPPVLFAKGRGDCFALPAVAIVGTRSPTPYGMRVATRMARALAEQGVVVVSGLARGIDAVAHETSVDGQSSTIAVLGTGADVCYPRENRALYARIAARGAIVSEMLPGAPAHAGAFPRRNRIIAALADVTVVVEAGARSGALITAQHAIGLGRPVAAVPGPVDSAASQGSNLLLRDGAQVAASPDDILALLDLTARGRRRQRVNAPATTTDTPADLRADESHVLTAIHRAPYRPDELMTVTGLDASRVAATVASLEIRGLVTLDAMGLVHRAT